MIKDTDSEAAVLDELQRKDAQSPSRKAQQKKEKRGAVNTASMPLPQLFKTRYAEINHDWLLNPSGRRTAAGFTLLFLAFSTFTFLSNARMMAHAMSSPQVILGGNVGGKFVILDDFREAYWWLRDNTPQDSRVMAWWDYGYQINGIANRTTIADGNTWNHEHIALLGKCLVSSEEKGWGIIRHLADYVLVWSTRFAGMPGDDLAKSPHMARISGSVYRDVDVKNFWMDQQGNPSAMMAESVLYKLHGHRLNPRIPKPEHFEEVYTSQHSMVRIWKVKDVDAASKEFSRIHHDYPPALEPVLAQKMDYDVALRPFARATAGNVN